jgi:MATE family multidrug resistance protein
MIGFDTAGMVLMNALIGAGDTRRAMWISLVWQWALFLPAAYVIGPVLGFGLLGVWIANGVYRVGQAVNCAQQWAGLKWTHIRI